MGPMGGRRRRTKGVEEEGEMVMGCGMRGEEGMGEGGGGEEEEKKGRRAGGMRDEGGGPVG